MIGVDNLEWGQQGSACKIGVGAIVVAECTPFPCLGI